jgi:Arc/MetJ-type ribon-helix-helix transcriptional regulator
MAVSLPALLGEKPPHRAIGMLAGMQTTQIAVRIPDDLLAELDRTIPSRFASRAEAVRAGLESVLNSESLAEREARHRQAWTDHPISAAADSQMLSDARALIAEEPW